MKKLIGTLILSSLTLSAFCGSDDKDSVRTGTIKQIEVFGTRASAKTPLTFSTVSRDAIDKFKTAQDLPFLLLSTPSVVATSDAGNGIGYTSLRIRGTDPSRINITTNDIPMNDAESHSLFWVNMPDLTSSVQDIQIQRGVGSSTNGAGAFGGSVNIRTQAPQTDPYGEISGAYGSFNSHREVLKVGSGLIANHFTFDARLSNIHSDGYIDRATTDLQSYFFQAAYYGDKNSIKFITFSGREKTYHAWSGVDRHTLETDRRYNPSGAIEDKDGNVIGFYDNQTDNYNQTHYQLLYDQQLSKRFKLNVALHYTDGAGYYEEYKNARTLREYGLTPFIYEGKLIEKSNLVRQKRMVNGFGGGVFSVNYNANKLSVTLGGAANQYGGHHFGNVTWVQNYVGNWQPDHQYYFNRSVKNDMNLYLKASYQVIDKLSIYADMQYRHINHSINGKNDKWDYNNDKMQDIAVRNFYNFFNPKAGLFYQINDKNSLYGSVAVSHKEPTRNNYTDAKIGVAPKPERLTDFELGYTFRSRVFSAGATAYYMGYKDQLVLTGALNEIGEPMAENVTDSYRTGIELVAGFQITKWLKWDLNGTFSSNKIKNYTEYVDNVDENGKPLYTQTTVFHKLTDISFSPAITAGSLFSFNHKGWGANFQSLYVSRQYLNNASQKGASLDPYFISNLALSYTFEVPLVKNITVGVNVNNIFNEMYESNGWAASSFFNGTRQEYSGYFPQAGINFMGSVTIRF